MVVTVLLIAGAQVPVIPFVDIVGKVNVPPLHIEGTCVKVGVMAAFTFIIISWKGRQVPMG